MSFQVDEPALREGLPLKQDRWGSYLEWAVDSFRLSTAVAAPHTQIVTHLCYSDFQDILKVLVASSSFFHSYAGGLLAMLLLVITTCNLCTTAFLVRQIAFQSLIAYGYVECWLPGCFVVWSFKGHILVL